MGHRLVTQHLQSNERQQQINQLKVFYFYVCVRSNVMEILKIVLCTVVDVQIGELFTRRKCLVFALSFSVLLTKSYLVSVKCFVNKCSRLE